MSNETPSAKDDSKVIQWVTFKLGEEVYGVNVLQVQEVLRVSEIAPVPGAAEGVLGIVNLRGSVVTVVDTRNKLGMETAAPTESSRIIIIEANNQQVGLLVDAVAEVVDIYTKDIAPPPPTGGDEKQKFIAGVSNAVGRLVIIIDLEKFLLDSNIPLESNGA